MNTNIRHWKYPEDETPPDARCYDCGILYPFPVEMCVDSEVWERINPSHDKGAGLLCHNCMIDRLRVIGITRIDVTTFIVIPTHRIGIPDFGDDEDLA